MPLSDERLGAIRKPTGKRFTGLDFNHGFGFCIDCMEMRPSVLAVENTNDDSEKPAELRHDSLYIRGKGAEKLVGWLSICRRFVNP